MKKILFHRPPHEQNITKPGTESSVKFPFGNPHFLFLKKMINIIAHINVRSLCAQRTKQRKGT